MNGELHFISIPGYVSFNSSTKITLVNYMRNLSLACQEAQYKLFHDAKHTNATAFSYHL